MRVGVSDSDGWSKNILNTVIQDSSSSEIVMGSFSQKNIDEGFQFLIFNEDEEEIGMTDYIDVKDGNTVTFFLYDGVLGASLDGSPEDCDSDDYEDQDYSDPGDTGDEDNYDAGADMEDEPNAEDSVYEGDTYPELTGEWFVDGLQESGSFTISADGSWAYYGTDADGVTDQLLDYGTIEKVEDLTTAYNTYSTINEEVGLFSLVDETMALYVNGSIQFSLIKQE